jgi:cytochrome c55X
MPTIPVDASTMFPSATPLVWAAMAMSKHRSSRAALRRRSCWRWAILSCLALAGVGLMLTSALASEPLAQRQQELAHMVRQECGSCHGMSLQGGLGPALLPADLRDKSAEGLTATIYHGRPGTAMPPWQRFLTEAEAAWVIDRLQSGFPE